MRRAGRQDRCHRQAGRKNVMKTNAEQGTPSPTHGYPETPFRSSLQLIATRKGGCARKIARRRNKEISVGSMYTRYSLKR